MDAVEVLLFGVVGLSVVVFLIIDNLDPDHRKREETVNYYSDKEARIEENGCDRSVGGDGDAGKSEILEREERGDVVSNAASCGKSIYVEEEDEEDNICREREEVQDHEYIEDDWVWDWDWEGVERSELEKIFGEAMVYANSNISNIGEDVKLQLYGLQKVALQGPCHHKSQPMALHLSARSKWNAWQKVGNLSAEIAMENYIAILSEAIPEWNHNLQSKSEDTTSCEDLTPTAEENM